MKKFVLLTFFASSALNYQHLQNLKNTKLKLILLCFVENQRKNKQPIWFVQYVKNGF